MPIELDPYKWESDRLVDVLISVAAKAGISGSGLVIDLTGANHHAKMRYLAGVVKSRLEGRTPPFSQDDVVRCPNGVAYSTHSCSKKQLPSPLTVEQVVYRGRGRWEICFRERTPETAYDGDDGERIYPCAHPLFFSAQDFELAGEMVPVEAE